MSNPSATFVLAPSRRPRGWGWIAVGLVAALTGWVVLVVLASMQAASLSDGSATSGVPGLDMVTVTKTRSAEGAGASLSTEPGAAALLVLPLAGGAIALARRRSLRETDEAS